VRITSVWGRSRITQDVTLYPGVRAVDVTMTVDWHEQLKMLNTCLSAEPEPSSSYRLRALWLDRTSDQRREEPCQAWLDLSGVGPSGPQGCAY
jgi:alpha-mannosidase